MRTCSSSLLLIVLVALTGSSTFAQHTKTDWRKSALKSTTPSDEILRLDIDHDGKFDVIERWWNGKRVRWLDENNDFTPSDTRGDQVVHIPSEGIVATGDLVVHPVPFGFNSYPREWIAVLDSIVRLRPRAIVPGHGPVMRDLAYVHRVRAMLAEVVQRAAGGGRSRRLALEGAPRCHARAAST